VKTDRDLSIERLLRRSLQTPGPPSGDCPDPEALAALADNALLADERRMVEAHVADCHWCQAMTAAIVRTTIPPGIGDNRAASPWWKSRRALNWLVPATAAATAVALWVAVPGQRSAAPEERQAEVQTAAAPPPAPAARPTPAPANADAFRSDSSERADSQARGNEKDTALGSTAPANAQPAAPAQSSLAREENRVGRQEGAASEQVRVTPEPDRSVQDRVAPVAAARAAVPATAGFEVISTDPQIRWRVGPGVVVQYSVDGGSTWSTQETGASAQLTAGSSPSPLVCWLVGRAGTVRRSADGGRQWQRVAFPESADLVAVRASNALTATVDLADGRRLGTTDGGQTWTPMQK
jgi:hypothetical protein